MHICLFIENTHPNDLLNLKVGGIANQVLNLLPVYEKYQKLTISLITKYSEYLPTSKNTRIYRISKIKNRRLNSLYFMIFSFFKLMKIHKRNPINLINIHTYSSIVVPCFIFKQIFNIPILIKLPLDFSSFINQFKFMKYRNIILKTISFVWFTIFIRFFIKRIDFIRAINSKMYHDLLTLQFPRENILRIPNGINPNLSKTSKKKNQNTNFGYVGRLAEFKNLRYLLEEFKLFLEIYPYDKLFFYGEGSEKKYILDFVEKNHLSSNILICGYVKDKQKIYSNIDVLIDPSLAQGISNTNLEAMTSNTLLIASNVEGNKDLIIDKLNGFLFNPLKKYDLFKTLIFYKENPNLVSEMLNNAKEDISKKFDISVISKRILEFVLSKNSN